MSSCCLFVHLKINLFVSDRSCGKPSFTLQKERKRKGTFCVIFTVQVWKLAAYFSMNVNVPGFNGSNWLKFSPVAEPQQSNQYLSPFNSHVFIHLSSILSAQVASHKHHFRSKCSVKNAALECSGITFLRS